MLREYSPSAHTISPAALRSSRPAAVIDARASSGSCRKKGMARRVATVSTQHSQTGTAPQAVWLAAHVTWTGQPTAAGARAPDTSQALERLAKTRYTTHMMNGGMSNCVLQT